MGFLDFIKFVTPWYRETFRQQVQGTFLSSMGKATLMIYHKLPGPIHSSIHYGTALWLFLDINPASFNLASIKSASTLKIKCPKDIKISVSATINPRWHMSTMKAKSQNVAFSNPVGVVSDNLIALPNAQDPRSCWVTWCHPGDIHETRIRKIVPCEAIH